MRLSTEGRAPVWALGPQDYRRACRNAAWPTMMIHMLLLLLELRPGAERSLRALSWNVSLTVGMVDQKNVATCDLNTWAGAAGDGESHTCSGTPQMRPRHAKPYRCTSYFFLLMHRSPWRTRSCGADRAPAPGLRLRARVGHSARPRQPPSASSRCSRPCLARPAMQRSPTSSRVPSCCATTSAM